MRFLYINGFILETCLICMDSLIISLHGNVNNSKFIKNKNPPESRPATSLNWPKLFHTFSHILTPFFSSQMHSFNHSASVHVTIMHIDVQY